MDTPRDTEGSIGIDKRTPILDEVLDQNAPSNSPLLERDNTTTNILGRNLGLVDRNHHGSKTDSNTVDDTTDDEHADVDRGALDDGTDDPDGCCEHDGTFARDIVAEGSCQKGTKKGACGHGGDDTTLEGGRRVVEVVLVALCADHSGH